MEQKEILGAVVQVLSLLIAAGSVAAAIYFGNHSKSRDDEEEVETDRARAVATTKENAQNTAVILTKLENMQTTLLEIKSDNKTMREDIGMVRDRLAKVEASAASAHKRIDTHIQNKGE